MDTIDFKLYIYESMINGDISPEMGNKLLELVYESDEYITEKKTREQYAREKFKKKYKYDQKTGTIDIGNGERIKVDIGNSKNMTLDGETMPRQMAFNPGSETIYTDKTFWNGAKRQSERDAMLGHEIGHAKMHSDNTHQDKRFINLQYILNDYMAHLKSYGIDPNSDRAKRSIEDLKNQQWVKDYVNKKVTDKEFESIRSKFATHAKKYLKYDNGHLGQNELEADRFGANKTSVKTMRSTLKHTGRYAMKDGDLNTVLKNAGINPNSDDGARTKKLLRKDMETEVLARRKALKDKELSKNSSIYKNESCKEDLFETIVEKYDAGKLNLNEVITLVEALNSI